METTIPTRWSLSFEVIPRMESITRRRSYTFFLLTAAHVLDLAEDCELRAGFNDSFVSLAGMWSRTRLPPSGDRKDDNEDVGYCCFDNPGTISQLARSHQALGKADVILNEPMPGRSFRVCGYPARRIEIREGKVESGGDLARGT